MSCTNPKPPQSFRWSDSDIKACVNSIVNNELKDSIFERDFRLNNELLVGGIDRNPRQAKRFMNDVILARSAFKKPIYKQIVIQALKFRPEWNGFLKFIFEDETRVKFLDSYLSIDPYKLDRWKFSFCLFARTKSPWRMIYTTAEK